ncbi:chromatin-binding transcription regulator [Pichia kluyveri]|uniref:Transcriptional adapter 2 n=1 Tax=Pichia kluyveri TaxID=36015 RepID=A0AAV5RBB6_PICKL|nr:chromatin-binding transcription regulator [Pichia kluyveri]
MGQFHCDVCSSDCTRRVRISCAECQDYDLCVPCFANGKSSGKHKPFHNYRVIEQHQYPIFDEDWGADEELLLIEGCQNLGLGNWQDIADFIEGRSKEEVENHYNNYYLNSPYYPLPDLNENFPNFSINEFLNKRKERFDARKKLPLPPPKKVLTSQPLCSYIQKYMPGRLEFEEEFDDDAEKVIQDMIFDPDESFEDIELKLLILHIYNEKLTLRAERKRLMIDDNLLDYKNNNAIDKKRSKDERDLMNKIKPFARIMSSEDFQNFSNDIELEFKLKNRIKQLKEWRENGILTIEDGENFEREKLKNANNLNSISNGNHSIHSNLNNNYSSSKSDLIMNSNLSSITKERHTLNSGKSNSRMSTPVDSKTKKKLTLSLDQLDISKSPDYHLLSDSEKELCQDLKIFPKAYICIKEVLFKEILINNGKLEKDRLTESIKLDDNKISKICDYFADQNWCSVN